MMKGADKSGMVAYKGGGNGAYDRYTPSLDELTGLGPAAERDGAIIALSLKCGWSPSRCAALFGISDKRVYQIVTEFEVEFGGRI